MSAHSHSDKAKEVADDLKTLDSAMGSWIRAGDGYTTARIKDEFVIVGQRIVQDAIAMIEVRAEREANIQEAVEILKDPDIDKPKCKVCGKPLKVQNSEHWGMACNEHWDETRTDFGNSEHARDYAFRMARWKVLALLTDAKAGERSE